ncbi:putative parathyroid hormone 2 receptor [Desulfovibrio ferrophilus]|uniref:Putative parathyroid hormone 2 receptor n=1 Tax=Desulfovibrio ferrophilus TaxID=241368 RepID=A0A2Z6B322_9BACT|nr:putative parathyroid hormone 2 receptor [Desulfovibrio ferrophilus]
MQSAKKHLSFNALPDTSGKTNSEMVRYEAQEQFKLDAYLRYARV